jgi:hypothetical protein
MTPAQFTQTSRRPKRSTAPRELLDGGLAADVGRDGERARADRLALLRDGAQRRLGAGGEHDAGALARESERGRAADPARGAGDDDDAACEVARHAHAPTPFAAPRNRGPNRPRSPR